MFDDDQGASPTHDVILGDNLTRFSLEDLTARLDALNGEITRVEAEIKAKNAGLAAAEAVFKRG